MRGESLGISGNHLVKLSQRIETVTLEEKGFHMVRLLGENLVELCQRFTVPAQGQQRDSEIMLGSDISSGWLDTTCCSMSIASLWRCR